MSDPSHTIHAQQALELSDLFGYKFKDRRIGTPPRSVSLKEPDGPSTAGGKQARQNLVLQNPAGDAIVFGWVDRATKTAEIRGYAYVSEQFQARKGHLIDVAQEEYETLLAEVSSFLQLHRMDVKQVQRRPGPTAAPRGPTVRHGPESSFPLPMWAMLVLGLAGGVVLGYLLFG